LDIEVKNLNTIATQQYLEKADHFLQGMKLLADDVEAYRSGVGLLAIHSAISLSDAIKVGLTGKRGKYQDHSQAADELRRLCATNRVSNTKGVNHLAWLLGKKSLAAYERDRFDNESVRIAVEKAERFNAWAYNQFKGVLRVT
jgi:hypothetical protein